MQAGGAIELGHDRRQVDTDPPLVVLSAGRRELLLDLWQLVALTASQAQRVGSITVQLDDVFR